ncbi:MAG: hypothetical protein JNN11_05170 [Candidatus Doudnabacteria bacterium]|nr:hypothetical protein [Candidatus Doudnabacteria bacterium]
MPEIQKHWLSNNHYWLSFFIGAGFLAVVQTAVGVVFKPSRFFLLIFLYILAVFFYNKAYLQKLGQYSFYKALRLPLLILAGAVVFAIIPTPFLRALFLVVSTAVVGFFQSTVGSFSENLLLNETLVSSFGVFMGFTAWAYLYTPQNRFYVSWVVFLSVFLMSRIFFEYTTASEKAKLVSSLAVSLLMAEIFWSAGFLPQHYSTLALGLTALYYLSVVVNYNFLFSNLDFKKIQFNLIFVLICLGLVLISTPWRMV